MSVTFKVQIYLNKKYPETTLACTKFPENQKFREIFHPYKTQKYENKNLTYNLT